MCVCVCKLKTVAEHGKFPSLNFAPCGTKAVLPAVARCPAAEVSDEWEPDFIHAWLTNAPKPLFPGDSGIHSIALYIVAKKCVCVCVCPVKPLGCGLGGPNRLQ